MPPQSNPNLTLAETILRFRDDAALAHDFVKGDETVTVVGSEGTYPSLAKLVADSKNLINHMQGVVVKKYLFSGGLIWNIKHSLNTRNFTYHITNSDGVKVYATEQIVSADEFNIVFTATEVGQVIVMFYPDL
jgi:hypothetical protein